VRAWQAQKIGVTKTMAAGAWGLLKAQSWWNPLKKAKAFGTYLVATFQYRKSVNDYIRARKDNERSRRVAARDLSRLEPSPATPPPSRERINGFAKRHGEQPPRQVLSRAVSLLQMRRDGQQSRQNLLISRARPASTSVIIDYWTTFDWQGHRPQDARRRRAGGALQQPFASRSG
jgi:hypothetical protein